MPPTKGGASAKPSAWGGNTRKAKGQQGQFVDKEKPTQVRISNITAAKGNSSNDL